MADARPSEAAVYGVTPLMRQVASAPPDGARTIIVASFLVGSPNTHKSGSFGKARRQPSVDGLKTTVDSLLARSPGLCSGAVKLHIIHDLNASIPEWRGVAFERFPPRVSVPTDRRWALVHRLLQPKAWDCAFAVDLSDVSILRVPQCRALPQKLFIGSDGCSPGIRKWLRQKAVKTRLNTSVSAQFWSFLADRERAVLNAGIVGGPRAAFEPALRRLVGRFRAHWAAHENLQDGGDMVLWNEIGLEQEVVTGYPLGPVNLPMFGMFCGMHKSCREKGTGKVCSRMERSARVARWVNQSRGMYWFGHKMRKSWLGRQEMPACFDAFLGLAQHTQAWRLYCACCSELEGGDAVGNACCKVRCTAGKSGPYIGLW